MTEGTVSDATEETASQPTRVRVFPDGPYLLRGDIELCDGAGNVVRRVRQAVLCRCGHSGAKPFCDGSHERVGFTDPATG